MLYKKTFGTIEAAKKVGVEIHRLYSWEQHGVVKPILKRFGIRQFRRYSQGDIERAIFVKLLVDKEGYTLKAAIRKLNNKSINDLIEKKV